MMLLLFGLILSLPVNEPTILTCHISTQELVAGTAVLDCGKLKDDPVVLYVPESFATFEGSEFLFEVLDDQNQRFAEKQPTGSRVYYTPKCTSAEKHYRRRALQARPCNPN